MTWAKYTHNPGPAAVRMAAEDELDRLYSAREDTEQLLEDARHSHDKRRQFGLEQRLQKIERAINEQLARQEEASWQMSFRY